MLVGQHITELPPLPDNLEPLRFVPTKKFTWPGSSPFTMWGHYEGPVERLQTTRIADAAIDMIDRYSQGDQPWHIAVHFPEPHDPYSPHKMYLDMYDPAELTVPQSFNDTFTGKPEMHKRESESWGPFTEEDVRQGTAHFFAYCTQVDAQVGRILDALARVGAEGDTLVAFSTDHGDMLGAHRMWIKSWMPYEEVWRIPLVMRLPGVIPAGVVTDHLVQTQDLPHTFLALAGADALPGSEAKACSQSVAAWLRRPVRISDSA
jgi:arylsulfatase A-like enzyme